MPNVLNEFAGDGVTQTFNFSMTGGYLSRDYVYFFTRPNDDLLNYTPYNDDDVTWLTDFSVRTANPIPVGTTFVILRSTTLDPLVDFQNTSRITEKNLDTATWQSIHIAAETSDTVGRIQVVAKDAKQESAQALAGAQAAAADAATAASSAIDASAAASAARAAALQAGSDATAAALSAATAAGIADAAALTANTANDTAITAAADSAAALTFAGTANDTANSAASQAGTAVNTANMALSTANAASTSAGAAVATANSAAATANTALTIASEAKDLVDEAVSGGVVSFNGRAGAVMPQEGDYTKSMVGLGSVDNTSDLEKPISTATSAALSFKADTSYVNTQLAGKLNYDQGAAFVNLNYTEQPSQGGLRVFQASERTDIMPDSYWWSLIRVQHPGYPNGYWQDLALPFGEGVRPRVRHNVAGTKSQWKELAYYSDVFEAIASTSAFTYVPSTFQTWEIVVVHPHIRKMVWSPASNRYVRAPWHAPGQLSYFLRDVPSGHIEVRSDVVLNKADFPDLAEYLGVTGATFVLDETRGEFLRALDSGRGADPGRSVGSWQDSDNKNHTHTGSADSGGEHTHTVSGTTNTAGAHSHGFTMAGTTGANERPLGGRAAGNWFNVDANGDHQHSVSGTANSSGSHSHTVSINSSGGTESRPRNRAYRLAVQY